MNTEQYFKNLRSPAGMVDVVLDTDAYNEIDDQFAIAYMLRSIEKINVKGIHAAPFFNQHSGSPKDGMEKSYDEILKLLHLAGRDDLSAVVKKGSDRYLENEETPVVSDSSKTLVGSAKKYSPQRPLYVVCIGAITNVASSLLLCPGISENIVIVWLAGNSFDLQHTREFNMSQDVAAARVVFRSGAPLVLIPCSGVVSGFVTTEFELRHWLYGKNELCNYLVDHTIKEAETYAKGKPWSRIIWDVTAVAWLLNEDDKYLCTRIEKKYLPDYDYNYSMYPIEDEFMTYIYFVKRDQLFEDLFKKLSK